MGFLFDRSYWQGEISGGYKSISCGKKRGLIKQIIVKPLSDGTYFDFYIDDGSGIKLFERESTEGPLNEQVEIPVQGNVFAVISNATTNELFKFYMAIQEI